MEKEPMDQDEELLRDATLIEQQVSFIRRTLLRAFDPDKRRISLTSPQMQALAMLTQTPQPENMTLKDLSERMGLAQSTVSGIVERLEHKQLVHRLTDPTDRRRTRIEITERVKTYMQQDEPLRRLGPLVLALQQATDDERKRVVEGLALLQRLLLRADTPEDGFLE
jgi:DNA-binding MarR family transcriptional regulator